MVDNWQGVYATIKGMEDFFNNKEKANEQLQNTNNSSSNNRCGANNTSGNTIRSLASLQKD